MIEEANSKDWNVNSYRMSLILKVRSNAVEEILRIMERTESPKDLIPYLDDFVKLVFRLMTDMNFKICVNGLNIAGLVIKLTPEDSLRPHNSTFIKLLMEKLGDSKIAIR